jgi:RNA recognition motif-containing protein
MSKKNQVFFTGFPKDVRRDEVKEFFSDCGDIKEVTIKKSFGFVVYI